MDSKGLFVFLIYVCNRLVCEHFYFNKISVDFYIGCDSIYFIHSLKKRISIFMKIKKKKNYRVMWNINIKQSL